LIRALMTQVSPPHQHKIEAPSSTGKLAYDIIAQLCVVILLVQTRGITTRNCATLSSESFCSTKHNMNEASTLTHGGDAFGIKLVK
jgi:hypothetical protein